MRVDRARPRGRRALVIDPATRTQPLRTAAPAARIWSAGSRPRKNRYPSAASRRRSPLLVMHQAAGVGQLIHAAHNNRRSLRSGRAGITRGGSWLTPAAREQKSLVTSPRGNGGHAVKAVRFDELRRGRSPQGGGCSAPAAGTGAGAGPGQGGRDQPGRGQDPRRPATCPLACHVPVGTRAATWPGSSPRPVPGVTGFSAGDEVIGFTDDRASQAEYAIVEAENLTAKPAGGAVGGRGSAVRGRRHRVRGRPGRGADRGRHGGRVRSRRRGRHDRRPAGQARRGHRDRAGQRGQPRMAGRARGDPRRLRRRGRRPDQAGRQQGRRVHRHVRRGLRGACAGARRRAIPHRHDRELRRGAEVRRQGRGQRRRSQR